ncbi:MAG: hypothetical protein V1822_00105 [Candidatus Micrarchaeota archaeon]
MKGHKNRTIVALIATTAIVILSIFGFLAANVVFRFDTMLLESNFILQLRTFLALTTLGFCAYLTFIYLRDYLELKSGFTLALIFSVIAFMLFSLSANPLLHTVCGTPEDVAEDIFTILPLAFSTIGLAILAWVSSK